MRRQIVYDLPTRLFHWLFAALFITSFAIAKTIDDESVWFSYHSMAGLTFGFTALLRVVWGFMGTKHAKFFNFAFNPQDLLNYLKGVLAGDKKRWAGHNPASSWAAISMILMALGLAATGYLMTTGADKESFEDIHELLANGFVVVTVLHVAGVVTHSLRHKDNIALSMVDGKKAEIATSETIESTRPVVGAALLVVILAFGIYLVRNFDPQTRSLHFFGAPLQMGEN